LKSWVEKHDGNLQTFKYVKWQTVKDEAGLPLAVEVAFSVKNGQRGSRTWICGLNWAPMLGAPLPEMRDIVQQQRIDPHHPVILIIHAIRPRFEFLDHAKSRIA
jgi:hypothetical protein